jgi:hypothetical protein
MQRRVPSRQRRYRKPARASEPCLLRGRTVAGMDWCQRRQPVQDQAATPARAWCISRCVVPSNCSLLKNGHTAHLAPAQRQDKPGYHVLFSSGDVRRLHRLGLRRVSNRKLQTEGREVGAPPEIESGAQFVRFPRLSPEAEADVLIDSAIAAAEAVTDPPRRACGWSVAALEPGAARQPTWERALGREHWRRPQLLSQLRANLPPGSTAERRICCGARP